MSDKRLRRWVRVGLLVLVMGVQPLVTAHAAQTAEVSASNPPDILHRLVSDPLWTQPDRLFQGVALPGDLVPTTCPPHVDMRVPLSLTSAVDLGLCSNPHLRDTWAQIKVQAAQVGQARAAYLPTLSAQLSELNNRTVYPGYPTRNNTVQGHMTYATLNWLLFDFGGRTANLDAADNALQSAIDSHDGEMQKLLGEIISDYFNAIVAQGKIKASLQAETLARGTEDSANRRMQQGAGDRSDLMQAQTAVAKAHLTLARDTGQRDKALAELVYALGLAPGMNIFLPDLSAPERAEAIIELSKWMDLAERNQPALRAAQEQWAAAQAKVRVARSDGLPTLSMVSTFNQNGYPNQGLQTIRTNVTTIGLTLNIPIFDGFMQHYKIEEAQARAEAAQAQMQDTQHQILKQVVAAYGDAVTALDALDASKALLESAQEGLESARNRYDHGVGSMIELLSAQSALTDALQQRLESLAQWNAGRMELLAVSGVLGHAALTDH